MVVRHSFRKRDSWLGVADYADRAAPRAVPVGSNPPHLRWKWLNA
jgi:hypothetical protein